MFYRIKDRIQYASNFRKSLEGIQWREGKLAFSEALRAFNAREIAEQRGLTEAMDRQLQVLKAQEEALDVAIETLSTRDKKYDGYIKRLEEEISTLKEEGGTGGKLELVRGG